MRQEEKRTEFQAQYSLVSYRYRYDATARIRSLYSFVRLSKRGSCEGRGKWRPQNAVARGGNGDVGRWQERLRVVTGLLPSGQNSRMRFASNRTRPGNQQDLIERGAVNMSLNVSKRRFASGGFKTNVNKSTLPQCRPQKRHLICRWAPMTGR